MEIISLYDFGGEALKPWAHAGYACYAYDIEHPPSGRMSEGIHYEHADLHDEATVQKIIARHKGRVKLLSAFPVCTDLAASGAVWWARKRECDPQFQYTAAEHAMKCVEIAEAIGCDSWYVENPVGALYSRAAYCVKIAYATLDGRGGCVGTAWSSWRRFKRSAGSGTL